MRAAPLLLVLIALLFGAVHAEAAGLSGPRPADEASAIAAPGPLARVGGDGVHEDQPTAAALEPAPVLEHVLDWVVVLALQLERHPRVVARDGHGAVVPAELADGGSVERHAKQLAKPSHGLCVRDARPVALRHVAPRAGLDRSTGLYPFSSRDAAGRDSRTPVRWVLGGSIRRNTHPVGVPEPWMPSHPWHGWFGGCGRRAHPPGGCTGIGGRRDGLPARSGPDSPQDHARAGA